MSCRLIPLGRGAGPPAEKFLPRQQFSTFLDSQTCRTAVVMPRTGTPCPCFLTM